MNESRLELLAISTRAWEVLLDDLNTEAANILELIHGEYAITLTDTRSDINAAIRNIQYLRKQIGAKP